MPGRPTIAHHRYPCDDIKPYISKEDDILTKLNVNIITAAEQQTMNYYMNAGSFYDSDQGRRLYSEIAMVEEQHVSHYGSLKNPDCTMLEEMLMNEYAECYLYYSCFESESDRRIKGLWEELFEQEAAHLNFVDSLLKKYEKREWNEIIKDGSFPDLLDLKPSKEYVREVLKSVWLTADRDDYKDVALLDEDADFFRYQNAVNSSVSSVASHNVIKEYIGEHGKDYRFQEAAHPISDLDDRTRDNTKVGRNK